MTRMRHQPIRSCLGCGRRDLQAVLVRVARDSDGRLSPDAARRLGGRGGYLHRSEDCWKEFARRKGMVRALRASLDRKSRSFLVEELRRGVEG